MSAAVALNWGTAWLQFLTCFAPLGRSKWNPRRPLEVSKSIPGGSLEALGSLLAPLEGSLAVLQASRRAPGAGLEASWAQVGPIWGAFWGYFLGPFLGSSLGHVFLLFFSDLGVNFGLVFLGLKQHRMQCMTYSRPGSMTRQVVGMPFQLRSL